MSKESRQGSFKKAISSDDAREKRSQIGIKLRKDKNEQKLNKKRNVSTKFKLSYMMQRYIYHK